MEFDNKNKETLLLNFFHGQELHVKKVKYFFFRIKITGRLRVKKIVKPIKTHNLLSK